MVQALLDSKNVTFLPASEFPRTAFPAPPALGVAGGRTKAAVIGAEDGIARQEISAKVTWPPHPQPRRDPCPQSGLHVPHPLPELVGKSVEGEGKLTRV